MSVSAVVPDKSRGNKSVTKKKQKPNDTFWPFLHSSKMAVTWLYATVLILYVHSVEDSTLVSILINYALLSFFSGCQKSAIIAVLRPKSPAGSISFNSWLRCDRIV